MSTDTEQTVRAIPMTGFRRIIAERLSQSHQTVPAVWVAEECDITGMNLRLAVGVVAKAMADMVAEFPLFNAHLKGDEILCFSRCDVGVAVDTPHGLVVPVIRDTLAKSVPEISQDVRDLATRARTKKLTKEDIGDGTITLTSPGKEGGQLSGPLINPPQTAIIGFHRAHTRVMPTVDGGFAHRLISYLTVTYDHRVIDGLMAGRYTRTLASRIESYAREVSDAP